MVSKTEDVELSTVKLLKKYDWFRGVAGFVRLNLQRIVRWGLKKSADIQGGLVFLRVQFREVSLHI
jgi:hypothetical protein